MVSPWVYYVWRNCQCCKATLTARFLYARFAGILFFFLPNVNAFGDKPRIAEWKWKFAGRAKSASCKFTNARKSLRGLCVLWSFSPSFLRQLEIFFLLIHQRLFAACVSIVTRTLTPTLPMFAYFVIACFRIDDQVFYFCCTPWRSIHVLLSRRRWSD